MTLKIAKWLFLLLIISLPLVRPFNVAIAGFRVPFTDFIFLAVLAFWMIALFRREISIQYNKIYIYLAFYGFALTVSTIFSAQPQKSFFKLAGVFYLFALAVLTIQFIQDKEFIKNIVFAWLAGTALTVLAFAAGFALFYLGFKTQANNYFLSHFGSLPAGNYPRIHALFANANMMCNFLNVSLMFAVLAEKAEWLKKTHARILQLGIFFAAFFTFSAGFGGMILSLGIWFWALFRNSGKTFASKAALFSATVFAVLVFGSTLLSPDTNNTAREIHVPLIDKKLEPSVRVLVWENAYLNFTQNPLIGKGTGTDASLMRYETLSGDKQILLDAHQMWLNIAAQTGLLGLIAFSAFTFVLLTNCRFVLDENNEQNLVHLALSCIFVGAFLYQGLSGSFEDARHLWIVFGLLGAQTVRFRST